MFRPVHQRLLWLIVVAAVIVATKPAAAFYWHGSWAFGTRVPIQLALGPTSVELQDGSATWNEVAAAVLDIWNEQLDSVQLAGNQTTGTTGSPSDHVNSVFFSNTVYGDAFGANTLAVTVWWQDGPVQPHTGEPTTTESDVIFNRAQRFNSYRGPQQWIGNQAVYDFRRVALHEFGHVLGLDHPNEHSQAVAAIMNAVIGDLDHLAADDIDGAKFLYGETIFNSPEAGWLGVPFSTQIQTNFKPTSYSADGLPPGLTIDSATGAITGTPTSKGIWNVILTAAGPLKPAVATVQFTIFPPLITSSLSMHVAQVGDAFQYQVSASNSPTSFAAQGLPPGVSIDSTSGLISGVPTKGGTFRIKLTAFGAVDNATGVLQLVVDGPRITASYIPPAKLGGSVRFQIPTNVDGTLYTATGLPSGLTLDPTTGVISGIATVSGSFVINVTVETAYGTAKTSLALTVNPSYEHQLGGSARVMVTDIARNRLYVATNDALVVYDCKTLQKIAQKPTSGYVQDLSISADGTKLWAVGFSYARLASIDLETFAVDDHLYSGGASQRVREGVGGVLYATDNTGILQIDTAANTSKRFPESFNETPIIEISPDRKTLYVLSTVSSPAKLSRYDISAPVPALIESVTQPGTASSLSVSHDGAYIIANISGTGGQAIDTPVRSANALIDIRGHLNPAPLFGATAAAIFSSDDSKIFQTVPQSAVIDVFDSASYARIGRIKLPSDYVPPIMTTDATDSYLFEQAGAMPLIYIPLTQPPPPLIPAHSLLNVSTRLVGATGDNSLIAGFIVTGNVPKKLLLRAIGPSLDLVGKMADPQLELHDGTGTSIRSNDNWNYNRAAILATGAAPANERDAAIVATLQPGSYTAVLRGVGNTTGVGVVEMYDLDAQHSRIANISTRGRVGIGDSVMIGGFIVGGDQNTSVLIRAIGPSLRKSGIVAALADTTLELHDGNGGLAAKNDDWRSDQEQAIAATGVAPADSREAAILASVAPGAYTAVVRGKNNTAGIGLVEVYNLTP